MPDIKLHRDHSLGLERARKVAWQWAEEVERRFDMECTVIEGEFSDTVRFTRSGVNGELVVAGDHFDLQARLGFLLGAFARTIESEIERNLDALLGAQAAKATSAKAVAKGGAKAAAKAAGRGSGRSSSAKNNGG